MGRKVRPLKAGDRIRVGRHRIRVPGVPSIADLPQPEEKPVGDADGAPAVDRLAVQQLDRVRAVYRPVRIDDLAPGLDRFIGREDVFRHLGETDTERQGRQAMMECPPYWPKGVTWVPICDLEILEILDDQNIRAG